VISGSDDMIIRVWKAHASEPLRHMSVDEKQKLDYNEKLVQKYRHLPEIKKIDRFRFLPKKIHLDKKTFLAEREALEKHTKRDLKNRNVKGIPTDSTAKPIAKNFKKTFE
jgi:WD repeat and SOF domain-containing protein 1